VLRLVLSIGRRITIDKQVIIDLLGTQISEEKKGPPLPLLGPQHKPTSFRVLVVPCCVAGASLPKEVKQRDKCAQTTRFVGLQLLGTVIDCGIQIDPAILTHFCFVRPISRSVSDVNLNCCAMQASRRST
jgi:hypothetical protein